MTYKKRTVTERNKKGKIEGARTILIFLSGWSEPLACAAFLFGGMEGDER